MSSKGDDDDDDDDDGYDDDDDDGDDIKIMVIVMMFMVVKLFPLFYTRQCLCKSKFTLILNYKHRNQVRSRPSISTAVIGEAWPTAAGSKIDRKLRWRW